MVGHKITQVLSETFDVWGTATGSTDSVAFFTGLPQQNILGGFDALDDELLVKAISTVKPTVVVNAIGLVRQNSKISHQDLVIKVNVDLPRRLSQLADQQQFRLIHLSTDCVFSGKAGMYVETDSTDAQDLYGLTKARGERNLGSTLVIRTSYVGREIAHFYGLFEWLLKQPSGPVPGYVNAIWSGLPTITFAHILRSLISEHTDLSGVFHLSSEPVSKFDLLSMISTSFGHRWEMIPQDKPVADMSLDSSRLRAMMNLQVPQWDQLIEELVRDSNQYKREGMQN